MNASLGETIVKLRELELASHVREIDHALWLRRLTHAVLHLVAKVDQDAWNPTWYSPEAPPADLQAAAQLEADKLPDHRGHQWVQGWQAGFRAAGRPSVPDKALAVAPGASTAADLDSRHLRTHSEAFGPPDGNSERERALVEASRLLASGLTLQIAVNAGCADGLTAVRKALRAYI